MTRVWTNSHERILGYLHVLFTAKPLQNPPCSRSKQGKQNLKNGPLSSWSIYDIPVEHVWEDRTTQEAIVMKWGTLS
jgi:hypothetical protein